MKLKNLYVAATSQHVGKTTSTLGLTACFLKAGINTGYCKPVGQKHLEIKGSVVDKDAVLFADLLKLDIHPDLHSPVILGKGETARYLDNPMDLSLKIMHAEKMLSQQHDATIYEGTGHPGVGSVADISNARVAKLLDAQVVMVVEGGIGNTIDQLNLSLALFREFDVPILGVIVNKVIPKKMDMVKKYVGKWLAKKDLRLLGVVPYDNTLAYPLLWTISKTVNGNFEFFKEKGFNRVENILAGSLVDKDQMLKSKDNLLVVSSRVLDGAIDYIQSLTIEENNESPLSGIIVTGEGEISQESQTYIEKYKVPLVRTNLDTYGVVIKISKLEVKINRRTPWKISKAIELIQENVNIDEMIRHLTP
ncbi:MAG: AAA family ATPase [Saprospiraceae bacterium]|nr:AAA family ATPase [Bacteroidia bacterium]NNE14158.1 AAA family ATPase [Saprospiraceae bacterium]NNL93527.1 AAA family ATPase [Saprospiraceae bacterium]